MRACFLTGATLLVGLSVATAARAACPGIFSGDPCNGGTGSDVCTVSGTATVNCNLTSFTASYDTDAHFVSPSHSSFRAYGYDSDGEQFCCEFSGLDDGCTYNPISVTIYGTDLRDRIELGDAIAGLWLECAAPRVYGDADDDLILGSAECDNILVGQGGSDVLYGSELDDYLSGGDGNDRIYGGPGTDTAFGGTGKNSSRWAQATTTPTARAARTT